MKQSLDDLVAKAVDAAAKARDNAYAPYSDFPMGAAVVDDDGVVVPGVLIENVSLGLAMCAERVAMFSAITQGITPKVLALCSKRTGDELTFPCGACLQVALELGGPELVVVAVDPDGNQDHETLEALLTRAPRRHSPGST